MKTPTYTPGPYIRQLCESERKRELDFRRSVEQQGLGICPGCGDISMQKGDYCDKCEGKDES